MSPRSIKCSIIKNMWHQQQEEKLQMCRDLWNQGNQYTALPIGWDQGNQYLWYIHKIPNSLAKHSGFMQLNASYTVHKKW